MNMNANEIDARMGAFIRAGDRAMVQAMLPHALKQDVVAQGAYVRQAAHRGQTEILATLLDAGMPLEQPDPHGTRALHLAIRTLQWEAAMFLLARGANPVVRWQSNETENGPMPLHLAARCGGSEAVMRKLIEMGADLEAGAEAHNHTPIFDALVSNQLPNVRFLLEAGADVSRRVNGRTWLELAESLGERQGAIELFQTWSLAQRALDAVRSATPQGLATLAVKPLS